MLIRRPGNIRPSEITSKDDYINRRRFMAASLAAGTAALAAPSIAATIQAARGAALDAVAKSRYPTDAAPNTFEEISSYNNYYDFGTGKGDPVNNAGSFQPRPWTVEVAGHAEKTGTFALDERIYTGHSRAARLRGSSLIATRLSSLAVAAEAGRRVIAARHAGTDRVAATERNKGGTDPVERRQVALSAAMIDRSTPNEMNARCMPMPDDSSWPPR